LFLAIGFFFLLFRGQFHNQSKSTIVPSSPNVVIILLDDAEIYDIGAYGGMIDTPNIDFLVQNGKAFSRGYSNPVCSPSRASLMTGMYPQRVGLTNLSNFTTKHRNQLGHVNLSYPMVSEFFSQNGYETFLSGKWHLGRNRHRSQPFEGKQGEIAFEPTQRGFDQWSGFLSGEADYYGAKPNSYRIDDQPVTSLPEDFYQTDFIGDQAIKFVEKAKSPFFLYTAFGAPHSPIQAPKDGVLVEKYMNRFSKYGDLSGLCNIYNKNHNEFGLSNDESLSKFTRHDVLAKPRAGAKIKNTLLGYSTRAAMIEQADINVGKIISAIRKKNLMQDTMFFFASDNGANGLGINGIWDCQKGLKKSNFEGGINVPFAFYWENKIEPGVSNQVAHFMDFFPTIKTILGDEVRVNEFDGISLDAALFRNTVTPRKLIIEHDDRLAIFLPDMTKYVKIFKNKKRLQEKVFDLTDDRFETTDLLKFGGQIGEQTKAQAEQIYDEWKEDIRPILNDEIIQWRKCYPLGWNKQTGSCE